MKLKFTTAFIAVLATALCFLQPLKAQDFFVKYYDSILQPINKTPVTSKNLPVTHCCFYCNIINLILIYII